MSKREKLLAAVKNNPKTVRFEDLNKILLDAGFRVTQPRGGLSHYTYHYSGHSLTVPRKKPYVKVVYVKLALTMLEELGC